MNAQVIVKKSADANYIPIKYAIIQMTVGANTGATNVAIQVIRNGWDTKGHYDDWVSKKTTLGIQGDLGTFEVVTLSTLIAYDHPLTPTRAV
jgi:hypothetical protein